MPRSRWSRWRRWPRVGVTAPSLDITLPTMAPALLEAGGVPAPLRRAAWPARSTARMPPRSPRWSGEAGPLLPRVLPALLPRPGRPKARWPRSPPPPLPPAARAIADNAAAVHRRHPRPRAGRLRITLDPVEFRGFRYHTGVAFTALRPRRDRGARRAAAATSRRTTSRRRA